MKYPFLTHSGLSVRDQKLPAEKHMMCTLGGLLL